MTEQHMAVDRDTIWRLTVDGQVHDLRPGSVSVAQAAALRTQSHGAWRWPTLAAAAATAVGVEEIAGLVFMARRQAGDDVSYDRVCAEIDRAERVSIDFEATDPDADPAPVVDDVPPGVDDPEG